MQMTFIKHPSIKGRWIASNGQSAYEVFKSQFGWHANFVNGKPVDSDQIVVDNKGQAIYICDLHATKWNYEHAGR